MLDPIGYFQNINKLLGEMTWFCCGFNLGLVLSEEPVFIRLTASSCPELHPSYTQGIEDVEILKE